MIHLSGVYAALLTPRDEAGDIDLGSFRGQFSAPAASELTGYAVNGATGEFTFATTDELTRIVEATCQAAPTAQVLCGIGAGDVRGAVARGLAAADAGAHAALLPMPAFFSYRQDDLRSFALAVAEELTIPVLLYNLPQFTSGLSVETTLGLISDHDNIIGIKDSSGSLDTVRALTKQKIAATRIMGNDGVLYAALEQGLCDGVVSGVACVLPELILALYKAKVGGAAAAAHASLLNDFIGQLDILPTPWGLKVTSAARGFTWQSYPFPLSPVRQREVAALHQWFLGWQEKATSIRVGTGV